MAQNMVSQGTNAAFLGRMAGGAAMGPWGMVIGLAVGVAVGATQTVLQKRSRDEQCDTASQYCQPSAAQCG